MNTYQIAALLVAVFVLIPLCVLRGFARDADALAKFQAEERARDHNRGKLSAVTGNRFHTGFDEGREVEAVKTKGGWTVQYVDSAASLASKE